MKTILVVDDLAIFREPIQAVLRAEGYRVIVASNGREAKDSLSTKVPNLVLLDLSMPIMDGITLLREMRGDAALKQVPVIVLSAEADRNRVVEAASLGIAGYLIKSKFSLPVMLDRVKSVLGAADGGSINSRPADQAGAGGTLPRPLVARCAQSDEGARSGHQAMDLKSLSPVLDRSEVLKRIKAGGELKGFSPTVSQVLKITASARCSIEDVAKAISHDHGIALKILKLANSPVYSRGDRVDTVQKAVVRIGLERIRQTALNIGVVERFSSLEFDRFLSAPLFWEHSIACGIITTELAHALKQKDADTAFTAGLLHDLGKVIFAEQLGESYLRVLETARELELPVEQVESRMLLVNHAEVMDAILHAWHFPKELVKPVVLHHASPEKIKSAAPQQSVEVLRLALADRLAQAMLLGSSGNDTIYPTEEYCRALGIDAATVRHIEEITAQQTDDTKFALLAHSNTAAWPRRAEQCRATLTVPFRPLYVSAAPDIDAYRIFCNGIKESDGDAPLNIAVVHIATEKERELLGELLVKAEDEAGVRGLPILLLCSSGEIALGSEIMSVRRHQTLRTPTRTSQFIGAINVLVQVSAEKRAA